MTERRQEQPVHSKECTGCFALQHCLHTKRPQANSLLLEKWIGIRHPVYHNVDRKTRAEPDGRRLAKIDRNRRRDTEAVQGISGGSGKNASPPLTNICGISVPSCSGWEKTGALPRKNVIAYKAWLQEHYKTSSANSMLVALNGFLDFMGETQSRVKTVKVQKQMFRSTEKEMSRAEYKKLIEKAYRMGREQTALIMETIGATGIRISELKYITVAAVKSGKTEVSCKGKKRQVYLVKELREKLLKYCRKNGICKGKCVRQPLRESTGPQ